MFIPWRFRIKSQYACENEGGLKPRLSTYKLNSAKRTSWGWWDGWDEPWGSEAELATFRSPRHPTILHGVHVASSSTVIFYMGRVIRDLLRLCLMYCMVLKPSLQLLKGSCSLHMSSHNLRRTQGSRLNSTANATPASVYCTASAVSLSA